MTQTIRLADYLAPAFWVETVDLNFKLAPNTTRVISKIEFKGNLDRTGPHDLRLNGRKLALISAKIDGRVLSKDEVLLDEEGLTVPHDLVPQAGFLWECEVEINPAGNTALEGLYMSNGMYCTQCEAQGFRKITYYPDRPDVMAVFTVTIEGDEPVLLSNGNDLGNGKWHDPWPKPAYLFALVAGDLVAHSDTFTTMSGRNVDLNIYVRKDDIHKCAYGMDALKRSMKWDEEVYGREYDLDLFNIVAVDDFNMGAMENKGLNIFNSSCVLASPETSTDANFERIEAIIAHEYFHNWTGNRITCRDWFQLCLKEGLTVFRDQQFTGDMRSHAVKRIDDVIQLRSRQFREDAGPLAHPVRPEEYIEINNFYTATVYEKGAELIGMIKLLVGDAAYKKALDLYFARFDGQACTIEDWLAVFEETSGRNLAQFKLWYRQSGTPRVHVTDDFKNGTYTLTMRQSNPPTLGQANKKPHHIPVAVGLLNPDGSEAVSTTILELTDETQSFTFDGLAEKPIPSLLRNFSAPVILIYDRDNAERAFLMAHDSDPFNKWEAGRDYAMDLYHRMILENEDPDPAFLDARHAIVLDTTLDPVFRALALGVPSEDSIAQSLFDQGEVPDPIAIHKAHETLKMAVAERNAVALPSIYKDMEVEGPYSPEAEAAGKRELRASALAFLTKLEPDAATAKAQFSDADNMTEQLSALAILLANEQGSDAAQSLYDQWKDDRLVMDKWFSIQVAQAPAEDALATAQKLSNHKNFDWKNPNRYRALIGAFAMTPAAFHREDGKGYEFVADWLIKLDAINPQTTARMCGVFETWRRYSPERQEQMLTQLQRIQNTENLSKDAAEIIGKIIG